MQSGLYKRCSMCEMQRPFSHFHPDARYRDGHGSRCRRCRTQESNRLGAERRSADYAIRRAAAHKRARKYANRLPKDFGHWMAGFIDGEGCFVIRRQNRKGDYTSYTPEMRLALRDDDRPILEEMRTRTSIGRIYKGDCRAAGKSAGANMSAAWSVVSKADCLALVAMLDRFPLRAKKARDYAIWREAVLLWATDYRKQGPHNGAADWSAMGALKTRLEAAREYR